MEKTKLMEESMSKLDEEMKRSDQLLSQMMPKSVSEKVNFLYIQTLIIINKDSKDSFPQIYR